MKTSTTLAALVLAALVSKVASAQTVTTAADPLVTSVQQGAAHARSVFTKGAEQMTEEDYAFRPTPEVRSFGELLVHVAETNYGFCSAALGEQAPARNLAQTATTRAQIQKTLTDSFDYCTAAYAAMADESRANEIRQFMGKPRPALVLLNFRMYHTMLHWGNAITYIRLRGKVPAAS